MMDKCWRKHMGLQPTADHFVCPDCGHPDKVSTLSIWGPEDFEVMDSNDCDLLHDDDIVTCVDCGLMIFGSILETRIKEKFGITGWVFRPGEPPEPQYIVGGSDD